MIQSIEIEHAKYLVMNELKLSFHIQLGELDLTWKFE